MKRLFIIFVASLCLVCVVFSTNVNVWADEIVSWGVCPRGNGNLPDIPSNSKQMLQQNNGLYLGNDDFVYFTFDLGYEAGYTSMVLDILKQNDIKAVFFLCGNYLKEVDLIDRMINEGHVIGNHTDKHKDLPKLSDEQINKDIVDFKTKFDQLGKDTSINLFRPPQGRFNQRVLKIANDNGLKTTLWSIAIVDWGKNPIEPNQNADKVASRLHKGAVMLFHITNAGTPKMLQSLIPKIKQNGYQIGDANNLNSPIKPASLDIASQGEQIDLPVVMYHCVLKNKTGKYVVTPKRLEEDFEYLTQKGYTSIFVKDLIDFQAYGKPLPKKPIMITFDDGNKTGYIHVFPLMKKYNMKCIFSVVGSYIDSNYDKNGNFKGGFAYLNYEQIKEMQQSGLAEFQNHSYDMHNQSKRKGMRKMSDETLQEYKLALTQDLTKTQQHLKEKTGIDCTAVTFPFGLYSKPTLDIIKELGFKSCITCTEGINKISKTSDLYELKRYNRPQDPTSKSFFENTMKLI